MGRQNLFAFTTIEQKYTCNFVSFSFFSKQKFRSKLERTGICQPILMKGPIGNIITLSDWSKHYLGT